MTTVLVRNAVRMMTASTVLEGGVEVVFADGARGMIPLADLPEIGELPNLAGIDLPNPYQVLLRTGQGETVELPWDFVRAYCDPTYERRVRAIALEGSKAIGSRIRRLRESAGMTQQALASAAGIGRVTLVRIESGEQSPRYETLASLAAAFGRPLADLLAGDAAP